MPNTTYLGLPYPALSSAPNVPQDMQNLASGVDTKLGGVIICTSSTRPSATREGATIYETDTHRYARYNGSGWEYWAGGRVTFSPTLTGSTTNPTLGTGSTQGGWYVYLPGPTITFSFFIQFGTSGAAAGSGQYLVQLPVSAATVSGFGSNQPAIGSGMMRDSSAGSIQSGTVYIPGSNLAVASLVSDATGGVVSNTVPWTWAASDYLSGSITYPI